MAARLRAAVVLLDRTGIRVGELMDLLEKRRLVGVDTWAWNELPIINRPAPSIELPHAV